MKTTEFDLETITEKRDTVIIDFNTETGTVCLQLNKETLLTYICDEQLNYCDGVELDADTYLSENLRDVVKGYLADNL